MGVCNQVTFLILNYIASGLVPLLNPLNAELNPICHLLALLGAHHILHISRIRVKVIDAPIQVPNVFELAVSFKFLSFSSQICLLFVPEMSASIPSYFVQIICVAPYSGIRGTYNVNRLIYSFINAGQSKSLFNFTMKY